MDSKIVWNDAAKSGLVLGGISVAYMVLNILLGKIQGGSAAGILVNVGGVILWLAKFILCIKLFKLFMQKFAARNPEVSNSGTFRFGLATALLSALVYSAFYLAWVSFIQPDMLTASIDMVRESYTSIFTAEQMESLDELVPRLPALTFFTNLIYCFLFGLVLSAIFSRNIPSRNPFGAPAAKDDDDDDI